LLSQHGQVLAEAEVILVVGTTLVVEAVSAALLVAGLAPRQLSMVAAFEGRQLFGGHTLTAEVWAHQVPRRDFITVVVAWLCSDRQDSLAPSVGPQAHLPAELQR